MRRWLPVCLLLVSAALLGFRSGRVARPALAEAWAGEPVRLQVVANSDAPADQALKIRVRDAVLPVFSRWVAAAGTPEEVLRLARQHADELRETAHRAVVDAGSRQAVRVQVGPADFGSRRLGAVTLPAGRYPAVRILLGDGAGRNWWCLLFPPLCLTAPPEDRELRAIDLSGPEAVRVEIASRPEVRSWLLDWLGAAGVGIPSWLAAEDGASPRRR